MSSTNQSEPPREFDRAAVVAIQGGGVFGLSMLGQLSAVVEADTAPIALAGTSAGAVVAALFWAGYSPKEIREMSWTSRRQRAAGQTILCPPQRWLILLGRSAIHPRDTITVSFSPYASRSSPTLNSSFDPPTVQQSLITGDYGGDLVWLSGQSYQRAAPSRVSARPLDLSIGG